MMHLMEPLFNLAYLGVVITLGVRLLFERKRDAKVYGVMAILLGLGDAFHLIPRIVSHLTEGGFERYVAALSWGEFVTSITMTVFYLLFYDYYCNRSGDTDRKKRVLLYALAAVRIVLTALPQNLWGTKGSYLFGILRNLPFAAMGLLLILWTWKYRQKEGLRHTSLLIAVSFLCYLPVVVGARFVPVLGALMIPKTVAYVLLVAVGYRYFIPGFKAENLLKLSASLLIAGLLGGVFFREFTKAFGWAAQTMLGVTHTHLIAMGFLFYAVLFAIFQQEKGELPQLKRAVTVYNTGLVWTVVTMMVRGIYQITAQGQTLFPDAALSGMAGLGHVILAVGLVWIMARAIRMKADGEQPNG